MFSKETNKGLLELQKDIPDKIVAETKNNLLFENIAKKWLDFELERTDRTKTNRSITNNTFEYYRTMVYGYLIPDFGNIKITELTLDGMQEVFDQRVNLVNKTLKGLKSILAQIFKYSMKQGYIKINEAINIELPEYIKPKIDILNQKQMGIFKEKCLQDKRRMAMLYRFELVLGVRPEEICGLKWNRIFPSASEEELARAKIDNAFKDIKVYDENHKIIGHKKVDDTLKTPESYRTIPLEKEDEIILLEFKEAEKKRLGSDFKEEGYVFLNKENRPYTSEILTNKMPDFLKKWELPHVTPYGLRHSRATDWARKGIKPDILKVMMGHTEIGTTQRYYIHLDDEDVMNEVKEKMQAKDRIYNDALLEMVEKLVKEVLIKNLVMQNIDQIEKIIPDVGQMQKLITQSITTKM